MIPLSPPFRLATPEDAPALADLVNFAGEGLPLHIWTLAAGPGEDPWAVGRARQAARAATGQIVVVDEGAGPVAELTGYAIGPEPEPVDDAMPPLFRPLQELENLAPQSWYVNILATYPEHRGRGHGRRLLSLAEEIAAAQGLSRMSIIVAGNNTGARRLYERLGYAEAARRPCDPGDWKTETREWVLLLKDLPGPTA